MTAVEQAAEVLRGKLRSGYWASGERLPSLAQLALLCNVSRATAWKAVAVLREQSLVNTRRGGSITAGVREKPSAVVTESGRGFERLASRIGTDLLLGRFPGTRVPPLCKLALQYDVSIPTVRKAVGVLIRDGRITRHGRALAKVTPVSQRGALEVCLISLGNSEGGISTAFDRNRSVLEAFESLSPQFGYRFRCLGFDEQLPEYVVRLAASVGDVTDLRGAIVNLWSTWDPTVRRRWFDLIVLLLRKKVPVVAIDQIGDVVFPNTILRHRGFRCLCIAGARAGEMVAEYLLGNGHRRIAYLTAFPSRSWARSRFEGMSRFCRHYGGQHAKTEMLSPEVSEYQDEQALAMMHLDPAEIRHIFGARLGHAQLEDFVDRVTRIRESALDAAEYPVVNDYRKLLRFLGGLAREKHEAESFTQMLDFAMHLASVKVTDIYFRKFLRETAGRTEATAWVCSDEIMSLSAMHVLRERAPLSPDGVALVGFDNWKYGHEHQITAYDFNMFGIVRHALMMFADKKAFAAAPTISEMDGYVVERTTTRR